jgi:bifunctional non-homologous end joining protein LigD
MARLWDLPFADPAFAPRLQIVTICQMARNSSKSQSLKVYQARRNFNSTPEPSGREKARGRSAKKKSPMFCVQKHLASHLHYDFRLEHHGVLLSWAVPKGPSLNPKDKRLAMRVEDHPLDYGDFEGVIPSGYGAGIVMLWDTGTWKPQDGFEDVDAALAAGEIKFRLDGVKLKGSWVLVRTRGPRPDSTGESRSWLLIKHRDDWAGAIDVTGKAPDSVKSFGDFADILAADKPDIWESNRPAKGGEAGKMLQDVIDEAAKRKVEKAGPKRAPKKRRSTRG